MKKVIAIISIIFCIIGCTSVYAENDTNVVAQESTTGKLIEIKEKELNTLEEYKEAYGSDAYGLTAYLLNRIRIYSIPFCFLGIAIGAIHKYVIGIRKLDTLERGMALIVSFVTILIICQILPLAFAVFVKFGRG